MAPHDCDGDEIGQLGSAFNQMSIRLKTLIDELYVKSSPSATPSSMRCKARSTPIFYTTPFRVSPSLAIQNGDQEVSRIVNHLARFYQISLNMGYQYITLEKELALTRHYVAIQQCASEQILPSWETDDSLLNHEVLKLILQPFVENAINHARAENDRPLHITIRAYRSVRAEKGMLFLEVEERRLRNAGRAGQKHAVRSILQRLWHFKCPQADPACFTAAITASPFLSEPGRGTKIVLALPL